MKELQDILKAYEAITVRGQAAALATVVKVAGSSYRRPGARMLVTQAGRAAGSVSGGCLESDVVQQAQRVIASGEAALLTYDTTEDSDIVYGAGLGCRGVIHILIERVTPGFAEFLAGLMGDRQRGVLATVLQAEGIPLGSRLCLREGFSPVCDMGDADLAARVLEDSHDALRSGVSRVQSYGQRDVFIEVLEPPVPLIIFGAGPDAPPLVRLAKELGWHVTVVDERLGSADPARLPLADTLVACPPEAVAERVGLDARTVAVLTTHNYLQDLRLLETLLPSPLRYLGILGPKRRTQQMLADLHRQGITPTEDQLSRVHGPAGLDIGADTPEGIALAIVAEINAVLAGRSGGLLRKRDGPIYSPPEDSQRCPTSAS